MNIGSPVRELVIEPIEVPLPETPLSDPVITEMPGDDDTGQR